LENRRYDSMKGNRGSVDAGLFVIVAIAILLLVLLTNWSAITSTTDKTTGIDDFTNKNTVKMDPKTIKQTCLSWKSAGYPLGIEALRSYDMDRVWIGTNVDCCKSLAEKILNPEPGTSRINHEDAEACMKYCDQVDHIVKSVCRNDPICINREIDKLECPT